MCNVMCKLFLSTVTIRSVQGELLLKKAIFICVIHFILYFLIFYDLYHFFQKVKQRNNKEPKWGPEFWLDVRRVTWLCLSSILIGWEKEREREREREGECEGLRERVERERREWCAEVFCTEAGERKIFARICWYRWDSCRA